MAVLHPQVSQIEKFVPPPEPGELALIRFLADHLDDTFHVFFQPMMDGDRPDVVILKQDCGVVIWEVKDWNLEHYNFASGGQCQLLRDGTPLNSPVQQVLGYKKRLLNLYIPHLCVELALNTRIYGVVRTALYFHSARTNEVRARLGDIKDPTFYSYGYDALQTDLLPRLLRDLHLNSPSIYFDCKMFDRFYRFLRPPLHTQEMGKSLLYTPQQQALVKSCPEQKKISGVAGSGKTYVLAKRAVSAHIRTHRPVLILTFNICVKNYIHDRISEVRERFQWDNFVISNYHHFFGTQTDHHDLQLKKGDGDSPSPSFQDEDFFESVSGETDRYSAIFIDEVQDFTIEWLRIIKKYFLAKEGEFVLFGDVKQNLYRRLLDNKAIRTNIPGPFAQLHHTQRLNRETAALATSFQTRFMATRYEVESVRSVRQSELFQPELRYLKTSEVSGEALISLIWAYLEEWSLHPNDVAILCPTNEVVRSVDEAERRLKRERTTTSAESEEEYQDLQKIGNERIRKLNLDNIRRSRRYHFWPNAGTVKISTIHSFKGLESGAVFVVLVGLKGEAASDEAIYTAITRCRNQLVLIGDGTGPYDEFFASNLNEARQPG